MYPLIIFPLINLCSKMQLCLVNVELSRRQLHYKMLIIIRTISCTGIT